MDKTELVERHYQSFINQPHPREFFLGMVEYIDYADSIPEFNQAFQALILQGKSEELKLLTLEKKIIKPMVTAFAKLSKYVKDNNIEHGGIIEAINSFNSKVEGSTISSARLPKSLLDELADITYNLYKMPEHQAFASKFVEFSRDKSYVRHHYSIKGYEDYSAFEEEYQRQSKSSLWGIFFYVLNRYQAITSGRARHRELVKEHRKKSHVSIAWELMNTGSIVGEWNSIEDGNSRERPLFFRVEDYKPKLERLHNYLLRYEAIPLPTPAEEKKSLSFDPKTSKLAFNGATLVISKTRDSQQHYLLKALFSNPKKEWDLDELWEKFSGEKDYRQSTHWKKLYNLVSAINTKIAVQTQIRDLILMNKSSLSINAKYLI